MKFTSRIALFFAGILLSSGIAASQNYVERVKENPAIASGVYHPYHTGNLSDTPAPKGYKPFYISHFGRHGSRYHTLLQYFDDGKDGLEKAARAGILTADGKALQTDFLTVMNEHNGLEGELSPLGAKEHKGVARRMYQRFTPVFNSRSRKEIDCVSSNIRRCIISMANFSESLDDQNPGLDFTFRTGDKYFAYIMKPAKGKTFGKACAAAEDSVRKADCKYDKLFSRIFTDPEKALELIPDPQAFIKSVYMAGAICPDLDYLGIDIFKYFDYTELAPQSYVLLDKMYGECGNSLDYGDRCVCSADDLLSDIISKADEAIKEGSHRAADLRFGHDSGLLPLIGLMEIKEMSDRCRMVGAHDHWTSYDNIPMCSNIQLVFYRGKSGDILVKLLYNEQETTVPAVKALQGPYYRWDDLKAYFQSRVEMANRYNAQFD